ncbi:choice-of-anchor L domain-containing protein [Flaviramulus aquimarinus]
MKYFFSLALFLCFIFSNVTHSQQISTDSSISLEQLILNNLAEGCVEITNIQSNVNGSSSNLESYGYFEKALSNFPFENGIVLSTGSVNSAGNTTNTNILAEGDDNWGTDTDLETALGISNTLNATSIEFDFVSFSNQVQFNYLLASEEYYETNPCNYSDGFAFLIKEADTANPYENIALIPGTNTPVNTTTIHENIVDFCAAQNEAYFEGFNIGDTNFNGRTTVFTANATITPNVKYHIKLVIADQTDYKFDSAVFIEGNSFNASVDLGSDVSTCANTVDLNADINNNLASYAWFLNDVLIPGENDATYAAITSGIYKVEITLQVNNTSCTIEDAIEVTLNGEQISGNISDFILCDTADNDGVENFDLNLKYYEILYSVPSGNYNISYHATDDDAKNNTNPIISAYSNTSNPETIHVRIEDTNNGCLAYPTFNLVVNEVPEINDPEPIIVCDIQDEDGNDGFRIIDLTQANDEITSGDTTLQVTYHYSQQDADNGYYQIYPPYININPTDTLYVRVYSSFTGCYTTTTIDVTVQPNPDINLEDRHYINACEENSDGFADFDLTSVLGNVLNGVTNATTTFHLNEADAQNGINEIANETNYQNIDPFFQLIYIRVVDNTTGCFSITPVELQTNLVEFGIDFKEYIICDDFSNDGIEDFHLSDIENDIKAEYGDLDVVFYESQDDLDNQTNPLNENIPFTVSSSPTILYTTVVDDVCKVNLLVDLVINPALELPDVNSVDYCDTDTDGYTSIVLSTFDNDLTAGISPVSINYFYSEIDAQNDENRLPPTFYNSSNPQTLYIRVFNPQIGCVAIKPIDINIITAPVVNYPDNIIICDDDQDAFSIVDLTNVVPDIVSDTSNLEISYFSDYWAAFNDENEIADPENFNATNQYIYFRVKSNTTSCFNISYVYINVNTLPIFPELSIFENCESGTNDIADFYFYVKDGEILNGQYGKQVLYFETEQNAIDRTNEIDKYNIYNNTSNPQTIFVRVESITDPECYDTASFGVEVGSIPLFNEPNDIKVCDDISNDAIETFDLTSTIDDIKEGMSENLTVTLHTSQYDAEYGYNEIDPNFTNYYNPQTIFARITNGTYCHGIADFTLSIVQVPSTTEPEPLKVCDVDYDGLVTFDLKQSEVQILGLRQDNLVITYHTSQDGVDNDTAIISDPENFNNTSNPQTVFIKINNIISNCWVSLPIELVADLPPAIVEFETYEICDNPASYFNLNDINTEIVDNDPDAIITYYLNSTDAEIGNAPISTDYNYTTTNDIIYIRVESAIRGCHYVYPFQLIVNPLPIANQPTDMESCDDVSADGFEIFDLSTQNTSVLGGQNPSAFSITYHGSNASANNNSTPLTTNYNAENDQIIYVRIENNVTGCYSTTQFNTIVHQYPNQVTPLVQCDVDYDETVIFDISSNENNLFTSPSSNIVISYFDDLTLIDNEASAIADPVNYNNSSNPQTIYIKVYNISADCYNVINQELIVTLPPAINEFETYEICDNPTRYFDLNTINDIIVTNDPDALISYHLSATDAEISNTPIPTDYTYVTTNDTIYIRIESADRGCHYVYPFQLIINPLPIANQPNTMEACDDASTDRFEIFDLSLQNAAILGSQNLDDYNITFHDNANSANNDDSALATNYNAENGQTIYARIENKATGCYSTTEFNTIVHIYPNEVQPLIQCDVDYDETVVFDISSNENNLFASPSSNIVISYFDDLTLIDNEASAIADPVNYNNSSNPQTIYIKVYNISADCYNVINQELIVTLPPAINEFETYEICDNPTRYFDLNTINDIIVTNDPDALISYHLSATDAEISNTPIPTDYTYITTNDTIYIRIESADRGCHYVYPFQLIINPLPIANQPDDIESCDNDYDNIYGFDLTTQDNQVLGTQSNSDFNISYYLNEDDANNSSNVLSNIHNVDVESIIYARIENNRTGCFSTTNFTAYVRRKPINDIKDQVICLENFPLQVTGETGYATDSYLWEPYGETDASIDISVIGEYSLTITSTFGCETKKTFNVIESEQATIEFEETVDFSDPNNITITVSGIGDYLYQLDDGEPQRSNFFTYVPIGERTITVIDVNGCLSVSKKVMIFDIPKFVTPNDDGYFDTWHITGVNQLEGTIIYIYNRYGKLMKTLPHTSAGWDGTYNGENMPSDDYWYSANIFYKGDQFQLKGHFTLRR